jgi:hypothetical protein
MKQILFIKLLPAFVLSLVTVSLFITWLPCHADDDVIYGCYKKKNGQLRIVSDISKCRKSEKPVTWYGTKEYVPSETCPNLLGDWDYDSKWAFYDPNTDSYDFTFQTGIIHITDQEDCVFYGTIEALSPASLTKPMTGAITDFNKVILVSTDSTVHGILGSYDISKGVYTKINYAASNISIEGGNQATQLSSSGVATRR